MFSYLAPGPALRPFVRDYLIAHFAAGPATRARVKPYAPKPEQGITFFVTGRPSMENPLDGEIQQAPPVSIFGQQVSRCNVHLPGEFLMLRVHFHPGALFRLLNVPLYEFDGGYFDAEPVLRDVREVSEQLAGARSYAEMIAIVEAFLLRSVSAAAGEADLVDRVASHMMADPAHGSLDRLAAQACLSPRQLNRKFTERIGVGPKLYGRLLRFRRAQLYKAVHATAAWPAVAIECGYTDYQHMVRDFKQFTNATPGAWLLEDALSPENVKPGSIPS